MIFCTLQETGGMAWTFFIHMASGLIVLSLWIKPKIHAGHVHSSGRLDAEAFIRSVQGFKAELLRRVSIDPDLNPLQDATSEAHLQHTHTQVMHSS